MACNHPLKAFYTGYLTENGKKDYIICPSTAGDVLDAELANKRKRVNPSETVLLNGHRVLVDPVPIPCGRCEGCVKSARRKWRDRMVLEAASLDPSYQDCYFVTLTYRDECLPALRSGELAVKLPDLQKFFKRLRHYVKFRYYACAEYGDLGKRPHYHFVYFGDRLPDLAWQGINKAHSSIIEACWPFGMHDVEYADVGCMAYVAGYVTKKLKPDDDPPTVPPFQRMSRRPGIGVPYALANLDVLPTGLVYGAFGEHTRHSVMPRLFEKFLDDAQLVALKEKRIRSGREQQLILEHVFHTRDPDRIGDLMDEILINERKRQERRDI